MLEGIIIDRVWAMPCRGLFLKDTLSEETIYCECECVCSNLLINPQSDINYIDWW